MNRISVKEAAKILNVSQSFIRIGMQRGKLPIGTAFKIGTKRYVYHISPKLLKEYVGDYENETNK